MAHAAFFDLDRTILSGASAHVVSRVLRETGIVTRNIPGESLMYSIFETFGENLPSMVLGRQAVIAMRGHRRDEVREAARIAAPDLVAMVQPYAQKVIDSHRAEGRSVVLATTTPRDLIEPFAELMGFDAVIATTYGVDSEGVYTGELDGTYVWSRGKRDAVRAWSQENDVDLSGSYAYSDSVFDEPLLASVGFPHCVNPDWRLRLMAAARRWPVMHLDVPLGVAKVPVIGLEAQQLLMKFSRMHDSQLQVLRIFRKIVQRFCVGTTVVISILLLCLLLLQRPAAQFVSLARKKYLMLPSSGQSQLHLVASESSAALAAMSHCLLLLNSLTLAT